MNDSNIIRRTYVLILVVFCCCGIHKGQDATFTFMQITDPQFGFFSGNKGIHEESILCEKAISKINEIEPAFVVITGDLVNDKSNKEQWDEFRRITSLLDKRIMVYLTPGNHDIGQDPVMEDIDNYKAMFGYDRFSFEYEKCRFIGFNSCLIKAGTPGLEDEQFVWLRNELAAARGARQIILFCHYPFFIKDPREPENYSNIKPESRLKYLALFAEYGVDAVFSGHLHNNAAGKYGNIEFITTSAVGRPLANAPSGLRIIKISRDVLSHKYFPLDSIPVLKLGF